MTDANAFTHSDALLPLRSDGIMSSLQQVELQGEVANEGLLVTFGEEFVLNGKLVFLSYHMAALISRVLLPLLSGSRQW